MEIWPQLASTPIWKWILRLNDYLPWLFPLTFPSEYYLLSFCWELHASDFLNIWPKKKNEKKTSLLLVLQKNFKNKEFLAKNITT